VLRHLRAGGLCRVFVRVDVAAGIQPLPDFAVMDEQHPILVVEDNAEGLDRQEGDLPAAWDWATLQCVDGLTI